MVGNELSVSAFVNPALRRLEGGTQAQALSVLARSLGRAMPVWYGLCLALLALESFLHLHQAALAPLLSAAALWVGSIVLSITALVPINNRIASLNTAAPAPGWEREHKKMGRSPPHPHSVADGSPSYRRRCIGRLTRRRHLTV
jgi:hypothetical protein